MLAVLFLIAAAAVYSATIVLPGRTTVTNDLIDKKPDVHAAQQQTSMISEVHETLDFCEAWSYSKHDPNVSLTIEKCDADSRTLVLKAVMRDTKNLTVKDAKAQVESKAELKSLSAGACTSAKEADCTNRSKSAESFTKSSPTYDKDAKAYVIAGKLTEKDLPKYYEVTFDKDDKLEGAVISFGTATEKLVFNDDGTYIHIYTPWYYGKLKKNNGGYDDFTVYGTAQLGTSTGDTRLNYLNDGSVRFGETATGATCTLGNQTSLWSEVSCTAGSAWWRSRYYAGYPIIWQKVGSTGGDIGLIGYTTGNSGGATDAATLSNGFQSIQSSGGIGTNAYVYMLFDTFHFDFLALNLDDISSTFGWPSGGPSYMLYLYGTNWPWAGTSGRHIDYIYYMPQNTTPATMADVVNDYAIFTRGITGITMDTGTLIESNNISLRMESGVGGCEVQVTANVTLMDGFPTYYECDQIFGTDIYIYNSTGAAALTSGDLWLHGINATGTWTWKDSGGSTLTNWNATDADGLGTVIMLGNHYGTGLQHVVITNTSLAIGNTIIWSAPAVSPASPQTYPAPTSAQFNITWTATGTEVGRAWMVLDGETYNMTNESSIWYYDYGSGFGAGSYSYVYYVNGTGGTTNNTGSYTYTVNSAATTLQLAIDGTEDNVTVTYPASTNVTAWSPMAFTLERNGTAISSPDIQTLAAGTWNYTATLNKSNYTASAVTRWVSVSKGGAGLSLTSSAGWVIGEGSTNTVACAGISASLFKNDLAIANPYTTTPLPAGAYTFKCNVTDTSNYTASSSTQVLVIEVPLTGCTNNYVYAYNVNVTITASPFSLDLIGYYNNGMFKSDMSDVYVNPALFTSTVNLTGGMWLTLENLTVSQDATIYMGNQFASVSHATGAVAADTGIPPSNPTGTSWPSYNVTFKDEMTGIETLPGSSIKTFTIYCSDGTSIFTMGNSTTNMTFAAKSRPDSVRITVSYAATDFYYRDRIIRSDHDNFIVWTVNAISYPIYQNIFVVDDRTKNYPVGSIFTIKEYIGDSLETVTEQRLDIESKSIAYLLNGNHYQAFVDNGHEVRSVGNVLVDSTRLTKNIILTGITQLDVSAGYMNRSLAYSGGTFILVVTDPSGFTNSVEFWVYNGTGVNASKQIYYTTAGNHSSNMFFYTVPDPNATYTTKYLVHHDVYGNNTEGSVDVWRGVWNYPTQLPFMSVVYSLSGGDTVVGNVFFIFLFIAPLALAFPRRNIALGMLLMLITLAILTYWKLFAIGATTLGIGLLMFILLELGERKKWRDSG